MLVRRRVHHRNKARLVGALTLPAHLAREVLHDRVAAVGELDPGWVAPLARTGAGLFTGGALLPGHHLVRVRDLGDRRLTAVVLVDRQPVRRIARVDVVYKRPRLRVLVHQHTHAV